MRALIATMLLAAQVAAAAAQEKKTPPPPDEPPVTDPKALVPLPIEGGYTIAAAERDGKPLPLADFKDAIVRLTGGRIVGTDRDRTEFLVATYILDDKKLPWTLDMMMLTAKTDAVRGLVKKDGFVLTFIHSLPGGPAPTEFKTKPGQQMFVLRAFVLDPLPPPNKFSSSP